MSDEQIINYSYTDSDPCHTHAYLWEPVRHILAQSHEKRVFELGCGNGAFARKLSEDGFQVQGIDPSEQGIQQANTADASILLEVGSAYESLAERFGKFPIVTSLEVVAHVYYPRKFAKCVADLLAPGGMAVITTPYHSYWKNLALAVSGRMDSHFNALWDHGLIKFWSVDTLTQLFEEVGLKRDRVVRAGRVPVLAKSMILVFRKP